MAMTDAQIRDWLVEQGLRTVPPEAILDGFCLRLGEAGIPLARGFAGVATLHPLIRAYGYVREPGQTAVTNDEIRHADAASEVWNTSPFAAMIRDSLPVMRRRLDGVSAQVDFPVLREMRDRGLTDWIGMMFSFDWPARPDQSGGVGLITSWTTAQPGGFTDEQAARLGGAVRALAQAFNATLSYPITRGLLATYLGGDAADHVLAGDVRLGSVQGIEAAILFADLRGFTAIADRLDGAATVTLLNACLDAIGAQISWHGGQILKFMGDGLLATFATGADGAQPACNRALDAATAALEVLA
jgi:adenylate cyclase